MSAQVRTIPQQFSRSSRSTHPVRSSSPPEDRSASCRKRSSVTGPRSPQEVSSVSCRPTSRCRQTSRYRPLTSRPRPLLSSGGSTLHRALFILLVCIVKGIVAQGQIEYRSGIENWHNLWVTSPGESSVLSQCNYIWELDVPPSYAIFIPRRLF